ncbi:hypothetical protein VFA_003883 [Vibrio furnissii CIP 102972]|nr:hypothetical protein VFA_003883 [Vibrio furnissii CIP 102972]
MHHIRIQNATFFIITPNFERVFSIVSDQYFARYFCYNTAIRGG